MLRFLRLRGAGEGADDLLQELWVKVQAGPSGPVAEPLAYLYRMSNNLMLDQRRAAVRRERREKAFMDVESASVSSGDQLIAARERLRAAEKLLAELGGTTDRIFRRFRLEGVAQRDIAEELGITVSAVEKHLQKAYRALLRLEEQLDAE